MNEEKKERECSSNSPREWLNKLLRLSLHSDKYMDDHQGAIIGNRLKMPRDKPPNEEPPV